MSTPSSLVLEQPLADGGLPVPDQAGRKARLTSAFTLIEILVVLGIIALLVGVMMTDVGKSFSGAQVKVAKLFVTSEVDIPLTSYRVDMGDYPSADDGGLNALWVAPASKASSWHGPYAKGNAAPLDPWGRPYQYRYPGTHNKNGYDIWSTGKSGVDGGDDNVGNW